VKEIFAMRIKPIAIMVGGLMVMLSVSSARALGQPVAPAVAPVPERKPIVPEAKVKVYDEAADARAQIAGALVKARRDHTRVLIQWGGNWCPWCIRMHELMKADKAIARTLLYEYEVIHIDAGRPNGKNLDVGLMYGAGGMREHGFPYLTVLDEDGKPIANQATAALELKDAAGAASVAAGHDPKAVLKFLEDHKATAPAAQVLLDEGLASAKGTGKRVFVHFGAPWCGWCHRLEDWMAKPEIAAVLKKDFVDVKIDQDRCAGGAAMLKKYEGEKASGIPWFAFLDDKGEVLITSTGKDGNTGFPAATEELAHFEAMLKHAQKNMTDAEVKMLVASLKQADGSGH